MRKQKSKRIHEKHLKNTNWSIYSVAKIYKRENPNWSKQQCFKTAKKIVKELDRMNSNSCYNNKKYYSNVIGLIEDFDNYQNLSQNFDLYNYLQDMNVENLL